MADQDPDFERTFRIGGKALGHIKYNKTPASPLHYEVWYTYVTGLNSALNNALQDRLKAKSQLSSKDVEDLYQLYLEPSHLEQKVGEVGDQISTEIDDIVEMLHSAAQTSGEYGVQLTAATEKLKSNLDPSQLKNIVAELAVATSKMAKNNIDLEEKLEASRDQIANLNDSLEAVKTESMTDQLTGISNRKRFDHSISKLMEASEKRDEDLCLLLIDIDHFKKFNDTFGHQTGDQVLRLVAHALQSNVKGTDIVARYGGEEFAILLPNTKLEDAAIVGDQLRIAVMTKELVKKSTNESLGRVTISIGGATYRPGESVEDLVGRADVCLYAAKNAGRNQVMCEDDPKVDLESNAA